MINIRYAQIRKMDISNGEGVGVSLFVQGCDFRCPGCFNSETWDFNGGKEWTQEAEDKFIELASKPFIKRISILGGEPLASNNLEGVLKLINQIRLLLPEKTIWLYTGYKIEDLGFWKSINDHLEGYYNLEETVDNVCNNMIRQVAIESCDVVVDGRYIEEQRDITLRWCGSKNQRVIDIKQSLEKGEIVLWDTN